MKGNITLDIIICFMKFMPIEISSPMILLIAYNGENFLG